VTSTRMLANPTTARQRVEKVPTVGYELDCR
jgi:hypothetical protein